MIDDVPNEILQHILRFVALDRKHTVDFWISGRQVSRLWRNSLAQVYLDLFILTSGRCNIFCGRYEALVLGVHKVLMLELFFERLEGPHNTRCVFKEDPKATGRPSKGASEQFKRVYEKKKGQQWKWALDQYLGIKRERGMRLRSLERPAHIISIYGHSLDSALPGLEYDIENRELSFQWEPMLAAFFSEQHELNRLSKGLESYSELADQFAAEQSQPYSGHLRIAMMTKRLHEAAATKHGIMTKVRRTRIAKQYADFYGEERPANEFAIGGEEEAIYVGKIVATNGAGTERIHSKFQDIRSDEGADEDDGDSQAEEDDSAESGSVSSGGDLIEADTADEHHNLSDID